MNWRNLVAGAVLILGLSQMAGELVGDRILKGLGAITVLAPCPKVFCEMDGYEPFAADFALVLDGREVAITPEIYSCLQGPYNRRNVYGAAIAGAPLLPEGMRRSVLNYGFGKGGPLRAELGLPVNSGPIMLVIREGPRDCRGEWSFVCSK